MLSLPAGDYSLTIHSPIEVTSPYTFRLADLASATPLTPGTPVSGILSPGNETDLYSFNVTAGERFFFDVQARTGQSARWRLIDPLGNVVFNDAFDSAANMVDTLTLSQLGKYTLLVEGLIGASAGHLHVQRAAGHDRDAAADAGQHDQCCHWCDGEQDRYIFTLPAAA